MSSPRFTDEEINALGSSTKIQRHYEDAFDVEVLENLCAELEKLTDGWADLTEQAREVARSEWPDTEPFGERIAKRAQKSISPLLQAHFQAVKARWARVRDAMKRTQGSEE